MPKRPRTLSADEDMSQCRVPRPAPESSDSARSENRVQLSFNTSETSGNANVQNAGGNIFNGDVTVHHNASADELAHQIAFDTNRRMKQVQHGLDKREVQQWLYSADTDTSSNYNAARKVHLAGTGSWFLRGTEFLRWKEQPGSVLWLEGGPGSGKTVLSSSAIEEIMAFCDLKPVVRGYASFFFDARNEKLQDLAQETFTRSLICQLSHRCGDTIPTALVPLYNTCDEVQKQPDLTSLEDTLLGILECFEDSVYIVVDALDECTAKGELLKWIQSVTSKSSRKLHLLVTSRFVWEIEQGLTSVSNLRKVEIGDRSAESDIRAYIAAELAKTRKWKQPDEQAMIETALILHSGMFRFVALQLHDMLKCRNKKQLIRQLSSLPKDLSAIYERIFNQSDDPEELQKFLQWLAFSKRDMTRTEIDEVGTVDVGGTDGPLYDLDRHSEEPGTVLTIGYGLVTEINGMVKLAHYSVKEYLIERINSEAKRKGCTSEQLSHSVIAQTCLAQLLYFDRESILDGEPPGYISYDHLPLFPLAEYAAENWVYHVHSAHADYPHLPNLLLKLFALPRSHAMINWVRLDDPDSPGRKFLRWKSEKTVASPLYYACLAGLTKIVAHLITIGADVDVAGGFYGSALQAASARGHIEPAKLLLYSRADVDVAGGDYGTALQIACRLGHVELAKLLVDNRAKVNVAGGDYGTALQVACARGHVELAKLLLDNNADVHAAGGDYGTALHAACAEGHVELAKLLLDNKADVNVAGGRYGTALQAASMGGHVEVVKLLLDNSADVHVAGGRYGTALIAASADGHVELVKLLLDNRADVNVVGEIYGTALIAACAGGYIELAKLLLDNRADVNVVGRYYGTALQAASVAGHPDVATLLREQGA